MLFSFKKNVAALFVIGSLVSMCNQAHAKLSEEQIKILRAGVVAATTYYLAGYHQVTDEPNKNPLTRTLDVASKVVRAPINFYNKNKDALHLTLSMSLLSYFGLKALNSPQTAAMAAHFKAAPVVGAFANVPVVAKAASATINLSPEQLETIATAVAAKLKS